MGKRVQNEKESTTRAATLRRATLAVLVALALCSACEAVTAQATPDREALLAQARSERAAGHRVEALAHCQDVLARWPNDRHAQLLAIQLLSELGGAARARELAATLSPPLSAAEREKLQADYASHEVRWAKGIPADATKPYADDDNATADIQRIADDSAAPADIRQRAQLDLLVALDQGDRAKEALADYAQLKQQGVQLPSYAENAVADAMLQEHRPREAVALYQDSIRRDPGPYPPGDMDPRIGLASAYLDAGRTRKALAMIDTLAADEPRWLHTPGVRGARQNSRRVDADSNAIQLHQDAGQLADAYTHLAAMCAEAPGNADLRRQLAMAELARGWPRRAAETLKIADTLEDEHDANAELDDVAVRSAVYDYADAQKALDQAQQQAGRSGRVQDAIDAWHRQLGWQFDLTHDNGWGNSPDYGDRDQETQATLASPLIDDHWRVLALARASSAALPEGHVARDRGGLGLQGFMTDLSFYVQALPAADRYVRRTDFEAGFNWAISDQWSWSTDWASAGQDVPLRAQYYGITGKTLSTAVQWRASELTSARLALYRDSFTDGNLRKGWLGDFVQRLHTGPNLTFDGGVEIGGSTNSETNRPYFNPAWDRSYALTGVLQNVLNQYDDRVWNERFDFNFGRYQERNFATGWMASARYGQLFQPHAGLRFGWGVSWHWQPYDGRHESRVVLDVSMHWGE
ncbi:poly-beta-1,6 N-acetyl-D-glucosamine export porin PgaA [Dyella nitratireducens]|uniref:Poly-beta-1,6 N-acetyl-D-glucosamine export porin PgaA n=1 Tax=Dyella nitratireducens TaxID=1849580 RepID=A0ABQ1FKF6_9GAMM|nr:poly-beta-1,6 N-acetyl-D-glucosamine export porin PgaA [Dyella nitratireducens]GLQ44629.1 poly-beta-1,6 N-acetyl-D-glucosamine export porin PgaA [Dyella nitratireducens]